MKKLLKEFKEFITKGDVISMAVGIIIGSAFTAIVTSICQDLITPLLGFILPENGFSGFNNIGPGFNFGNLINAIITFLMTALVLFIILKVVNGAKNIGKKKDETPAAPTTKICPKCMSEINIAATKCPCCTSDLDK